MSFYFDKKQMVVIGLLFAGLLTGGVVLWRQNSAGFLVAGLNRAMNGADNWMEIKPRVANVAGQNRELGKTGDLDNLKENGKSDKPAKQVIQWCDVNSGAAPLAEKGIIINEVAWMGTAAGYSDEWMELKNITANPISLAGWQVQNKKQKIKIYFDENEILDPGALYLLERTDDESAPGITADKIYTGGMNNINEALYLFDQNCVLRDAAIGLPKWPAGDNAAKNTMIRIPGLLWKNGIAGGTPKAENQ